MIVPFNWLYYECPWLILALHFLKSNLFTFATFALIYNSWRTKRHNFITDDYIYSNEPKKKYLNYNLLCRVTVYVSRVILLHVLWSSKLIQYLSHMLTVVISEITCYLINPIILVKGDRKYLSGKSSHRSFT